jgi:hypothetical protein
MFPEINHTLSMTNLIDSTDKLHFGGLSGEGGCGGGG